MNKNWEPTAEVFDQFLAWLDPDRECAGQRYEHIRHTLIIIFRSRGCLNCEELADETINRVIRRVPEIAPTYVGDPVRYFCAVAHKLHLEYGLRLSKQPVSLEVVAADLPAPLVSTAQDEEFEYACLERCLEKLPPEQRELILQYYQETKQAKIDYRKSLAERLGIALNALRIRAYRIRNELQTCLKACLEQRPK